MGDLSSDLSFHVTVCSRKEPVDGDAAGPVAARGRTGCVNRRQTPQAQPHAATQENPSHASHWQIGDIAVHRIDEIKLPPATGPWLLPGATPDVVAGIDWLSRPSRAPTTGST